MFKRNLHLILATVATLSIIGCEKPGQPETDPGKKPGTETPPEEIVDELPEPMTLEQYSPSLISTFYRPIIVKRASKAPVSKWTEEKTRILPYILGFEADTTVQRYKSVTNKYGSRTDWPRHEATGRFRTEKIDGRWWIIDPEGYMHYQRSVTSLRKGTNTEAAWQKRFALETRWMRMTQHELAGIGFHGTGAFCTDTYDDIQQYNASYPDAPMTLAPSFGFLSQFRSKYDLSDPGGKSENRVGLVFDSRWGQFCEDYIREALAPYLEDPDVLGFFSDNEINFSSQNSMILQRFLSISNSESPARIAAAEFMAEHDAVSVTEELNSEFAGIVAEKYYKGVKDAIDKIDPGMMYLGSRLHGTPKYLEGVIRAAGKYCDIISINYYSRWSPELDTYVKYWGEWADAPFLVTEFYTKGTEDSDLPNSSGAGFAVPTQADRAYAYQHFTLGLLEAQNCVGWHWFKYQDDAPEDNSGQGCNKGVYDNDYNMYPKLGRFMKAINFNVYDLVEFFDSQR